MLHTCDDGWWIELITATPSLLAAVTAVTALPFLLNLPSFGDVGWPRGGTATLEAAAVEEGDAFSAPVPPSAMLFMHLTTSRAWVLSRPLHSRVQSRPDVSRAAAAAAAAAAGSGAVGVQEGIGTRGEEAGHVGLR